MGWGRLLSLSKHEVVSPILPPKQTRTTRNKKLAYNCAKNWRNIMSTKSFQLTAVIERDKDWFVATCPEVDVVSQGKNIEEARSNLLEAVELFFEVASPSEIKRRLKKETYVMPLMPVVPNLKAKPSIRA